MRCLDDQKGFTLIDRGYEFYSEYILRWIKLLFMGIKTSCWCLNSHKKTTTLIHVHPARKKRSLLCITQLPCNVYAMGCGKKYASGYPVWINTWLKYILCTEHWAAATIHVFAIQNKHLPTLRSTWQRFNLPNILFSPSHCSGVSLAGWEGWRGCCGVRGCWGACGVSRYSGYWGTCGVCG